MANHALITRRGALSTFAGAGASLLTAPSTYAAHLGLPQETLDAYRECSSAESRLQHHLLCAAMTLDEIVSAESSRWWLTGAGASGRFDPYFKLVRFDRYSDFSEQRVPKTMDLERATTVYTLSGGRTDWSGQ